MLVQAASCNTRKLLLSKQSHSFAFDALSNPSDFSVTGSGRTTAEATWCGSGGGGAAEDGASRPKKH
jgi:hypothetical protein